MTPEIIQNQKFYLKPTIRDNSVTLRVVSKNGRTICQYDRNFLNSSFMFVMSIPIPKCAIKEALIIETIEFQTNSINPISDMKKAKDLVRLKYKKDLISFHNKRILNLLNLEVK